MLDYKRIIGMYYSNGHSGREIAESLQCMLAVSSFLGGVVRTF